MALYGAMAQRLALAAHNCSVQGSNPCGPTISRQCGFIRDALEEMACVLEIYDDCTDGYEKGEGKIKNPIPRHGAATHKNMRKRR